uniref:Uncharacterized protein n=1 Tax=candidate division CPR3 bacterium TaxID=2268181 RepID=A0A7C5YS20_UNCC3
MATTLSFKDIIDLPQWRTLANSITATAAGSCLCGDSRNDASRDPFLYLLINATTFQRYNVLNDEWQTLTSPALAGTFGAGASSVFVASAGPSGTLATGATTTSVVLSTALPAAVGVNQLANNGSGVGYKIRIIGNATGSSGKTEEKYIIGNTAGTTPTIYLDSALTFTPIAGDRYEILSGRVMLMSAGTLAAGIVKAYDIATNSYVTVTQTNLPATISTDSENIVLDELFVPSTRNPGEGFFGNLVASASSSTSITGQASGGDAGVLANEYRNFQIRIVQDTTTPTAVGQRRIISSHTAGPSPIYTVPTWTVTPSATATFVIENNNDILLSSSASTTMYSYRMGGFTADGTWSYTGTVGTNGALAYAVRPAASGAGTNALPSWGLTLDSAKLARHSYIYWFRGGASNTLDLLDIAGASGTGAWTAAIAYGGSTAATTFTTGTGSCYDGATNTGKYGYINVNATQRFLRFDVLNRVLEPWAYLPYAQNTATIGEKIATSLFIDGTTKLAFLYAIQSTGTVFWNCAIQR